MGKLSSIEEVERRRELEEAQEMAAAQEAFEHEHASGTGAPAQVQPQAGDFTRFDHEPGTSPQAERAEQPDNARVDMTAAEEADFHGLSSVGSMGVGQKLIIAIAVAVVIVAVVYVLNSWLHFM